VLFPFQNALTVLEDMTNIAAKNFILLMGFNY